MRTYIWGGDYATIPNAFAGAKDSQLEHRRVDGIGLLGSGSKNFELNIRMWRWGRPTRGSSGRDMHGTDSDESD